MPPTGYLRYLQASLSLVSETLATDESIVRVEQGQTRYGRPTFVYYRFLIATFRNMTGNEPLGPRTVVVECDVDSPDAAHAVPISAFKSLQLPPTPRSEESR